ncbi:MAG: universal stress protein [Pseudonocardia sp.]|nr:universal stress protein [Pseudonocardia sp.]
MSGLWDGRPVVVGIDGSWSARRAAVWASKEASCRNVRLRLVTAVSVPSFTFAGRYAPHSAELFAELETKAREQLEQTRAEVVTRHPALEVDVKVRPEHPVSALITESKEAALVVLGSAQEEPRHRLISNSLAVSLAAHGSSPVAVIRSREPGLDILSDGPVVVGVDGSPVSEAAVAIAFDEASTRAAELIAVHCWIDFASDIEYFYASQYVIDWHAIESREEEMLAERLAGWQERYPDVKVRRVISRDKPAHSLLSHATATTAQLLVVGSRGRGGFVGLLLGSVSQNLIHNVSCPLIVARPARDT